MVTARDGARMAVFSQCGHDRSAEWLLSFRRQHGGRRMAVSTDLSETRLCRIIRKYAKTIEKDVFGFANHDIDNILSLSTGTGIRFSRNGQ